MKDIFMKKQNDISNQSAVQYLGAVVVALALLALSSCELSVGKSARVAEPQTYSLDGTKWISPSITDGNDPRTMNQTLYAVSPAGRLLLRFESLSSKESSISLGDGRRVYIDIALKSGENAANAEASLELCPLVKNWMMLATWNSAHPMLGGDWASDGGDFDGSGCVRGVNQVVGGADTLRFDVTQWLIDYVRGRQMNFGLILVSSGANVQVRGDADGSHSPRISWIKQP